MKKHRKTKEQLDEELQTITAYCIGHPKFLDFVLSLVETEQILFTDKLIKRRHNENNNVQ